MVNNELYKIEVVVNNVMADVKFWERIERGLLSMGMEVDTMNDIFREEVAYVLQEKIADTLHDYMDDPLPF